MRTRKVKIDNPKAFKKEIEEAGRILKTGGLVAFPTETVYGLGADGLNGEACAAIYEAKGRPSDNPLILHIADWDMLGQITESVPHIAEMLMTAFCPGPLTLILKKSDIVPERVTGGLDTVGIRMPDNDIARALIRSGGCPVAAPSANLSGRPSPTTADAVFKDMNGRIPMILDGGACRFGVESTIVDCTGKRAMILRPGAITREMLEDVLGEVDVDQALIGNGDIPRAPGMKYTHYAPKAPLTLIESCPELMPEAFRREIVRLMGEGHRPGIIASDEVVEALTGLVPQELRVSYGRQGNLREIAARLYEALRSFDDRDADVLLAEGTDDMGIGLAIMNRLHKASGFRSIIWGKEGGYEKE
ncbi:MAG TPA: threonylcarbamoyl-AMP synthase [Selenomonas sp.]|nr:threonylcarbamoyl-AMP synthase [Selenomonas sp.]